MKLLLVVAGVSVLLVAWGVREARAIYLELVGAK